MADLSRRRTPCRVVSSPGRAPASAAVPGTARPPARPRRRNVRWVSPQSTGLSCPFSVLTQRLATGATFYRDSSGVLYRTSGPPRGSAPLPTPPSWGTLRATERSRSTTSFPLLAQTRRPRFVSMTYDIRLETSVFFCFRRGAETAQSRRRAWPRVVIQASAWPKRALADAGV